jgi:hypothetical protein
VECLFVETLIIRVLKVRQNKEGQIVRNDRILPVSMGLSLEQIKTINDMDKSILVQLKVLMVLPLRIW